MLCLLILDVFFA
jgi:hypothetical protein